MQTNKDDLNQEWDVIVIGAGMGGATLGHQLAASGRRVLFLERGDSHLASDEGFRGDYAEMQAAWADGSEAERMELLSKAGRWPEAVEDRSCHRVKRHVPFIGQGAGGSSAIYGAAMERFFPGDFTPGKFHAGAEDADVPDVWPFGYQELAPFYRQAEHLYRVRGTPDPLRVDGHDAVLKDPGEMNPANRELAEHLGGQGLHPYRLPMACEFAPGCQGCQGYLCNKDCKNDSVRVSLMPALRDHGAKLLDHCEVTRLHAQGNLVSAVECRRGGEELLLRAKQVVLAAGALATPAILLRSTSPEWPQGLANHSGMVGRNLMRHCIDLYAIYPNSRPGADENVKEIAFNDFYTHQGKKFGSVQSFGRLPPATMLVDDIRHQVENSPLSALAPVVGFVSPLLRPIMNRVLKGSLLVVTTLEDLPRESNRVYPLDDDGIAIEYRPDVSTRARIAEFRKIMAGALKPLRYRLLKQAENNERIAHACGTCRMGDDPETSVVDRFNRTHDLDNLYIVDASFFPTSGGINPSLTIAANALRVADHLEKQHA